MNAYTRQDLSVMQAWPLERKIRVTQAKIIEWYHHYGGKVAVSFSGGKDSTVLLDLARRAFPDIPAVFVDTGLEYPEIREFVKTVPNVTWLRGGVPLVIGVAADFEIDALAACALTGHGRNDLLSTGFPVISVQGPLLHDETALIGNEKRRIQQDTPFHVSFIVF